MKKILLATLLLIPAVFSAESLPKTINGYIPADRHVAGANVRIHFGEDYAQSLGVMRDAMEKAKVKDANKFLEFQKAVVSKMDEPIPNDPILGLSKEDYEKYLTSWNARKFLPVENVSVRLEDAGEGKWKISAFGQAANNNVVPLPLHNLVYDSKSDNWTSPNGSLARKGDYKASKNSLLGIDGELTGPHWVFEEKDDFGTVMESLSIGKNTAGDVFLIYRLNEANTVGQLVSQNAYLIRVEAKNLKVDALKQGARDKVNKK